MKKKSFEKKLTLLKATVANLSDLELNEVKAGAASVYCGTAPNCTYSCTGGPASRYTNCVTQCCTVIDCY
jgi:hypothetical protein